MLASFDSERAETEANTLQITRDPHPQRTVAGFARCRPSLDKLDFIFTLFTQFMA